MAEINIIALPANNAGIHGNNLNTSRRNMATRARNAGYQFINNFADHADLLARVKTILDADPSHCLKRLEINAHGNPDICDGIEILTESGFVRRYRDLRDQLCDETHLLLTGCNTGLRPRSGRRNSLAERIASAIPFDATNFAVRVSVWGLAGYGLQGRSAMEQNMEVHHYKSYGSRRWGAYPGGRDATGGNAWNRFNNW